MYQVQSMNNYTLNKIDNEYLELKTSETMSQESAYYAGKFFKLESRENNKYLFKISNERILGELLMLWE